MSISINFPLHVHYYLDDVIKVGASPKALPVKVDGGEMKLDLDLGRCPDSPGAVQVGFVLQRPVRGGQLTVVLCED
jgi:hypothetical protein